MREHFYLQWARFLTWFGDIKLATEPPKVKAAQILAACAASKPGDVILRSYNCYLDGYLIRAFGSSKFTHSGVVVKQEGFNPQMSHFVAEGCTYTNVIDFLKDCDAFAILRYPGLQYDQVQQIKRRAMFHANQQTPYDFYFELDDEDSKFYCHEGVVDCYHQAGIKIPPNLITLGVWPFKYKKRTYTADSFLDVFYPIYLFNAD